MSIQSATASLKRWIVDDALPFWGSTGFDRLRGSFVEGVDFLGRPMLDAPRRAMVQARQIYVFAHAETLKWWPGGSMALSAARNLISTYYSPDGQPGWIFSATPHGAICDARREFYTQSFALYGLAWAYKLEADPLFRDVAQQTIADLDRYFALPLGGFATALPANARAPQQNPHMHCLEAMIAWYDVTHDPAFLERAARLTALMTRFFLNTTTNGLTEHFDDTWSPAAGIAGQIYEPGHHFEWYWLMRRFEVLAKTFPDPVADRLLAFANRHGFDSGGLVVDEILNDGSIYKPSRRCWPQTEAIKASAVAFESYDFSAAKRADLLIDKLQMTFLGRPIEGGWIDHIDGNGAPLSSSIPASTLYHVFLAATEADRVWAKEATRNTRPADFALSLQRSKTKTYPA